MPAVQTNAAAVNVTPAVLAGAREHREVRSTYEHFGGKCVPESTGLDLCRPAHTRGFQGLATARPEIASEWHPTKNASRTPETITVSNGPKAWWLAGYIGAMDDDSAYYDRLGPWATSAPSETRCTLPTPSLLHCGRAEISSESTLGESSTTQ